MTLAYCVATFYDYKYFFISDFLKGVELLLLGCFKVIMHTPELISSRMPWGTCLTSFHSSFIQTRTSWTNNIRWITWRDFSEEDDYSKVSRFSNFLSPESTDETGNLIFRATMKCFLVLATAELCWIRSMEIKWFIYKNDEVWIVC